jgi:GrpB-like predicted nucleotidyltransferase (UPF0157 family)
MRQVVVVPHDPNWREAFLLASKEVGAALGGNLLEIHHIGSTAIAGIYAKPVIDMLAVVLDIAAVDRCSGEMESLGYVEMGEFGVAGRRFFRRDNSAGDRTDQVHIFQAGSPHIRRHLAFRDFMRSHAELATQYSDLKSRQAEAHPNDIEMYMDGKDGFIKEMEAKAMAWVDVESGTE